MKARSASMAVKDRQTADHPYGSRTGNGPRSMSAAASHVPRCNFGSSEVLLSLDRDRDAIAELRYESKQKGYELYIPAP
jgi:hypothetical protein